MATLHLEKGKKPRWQISKSEMKDAQAEADKCKALLTRMKTAEQIRSMEGISELERDVLIALREDVERAVREPRLCVRQLTVVGYQIKKKSGKGAYKRRSK